MLRQMHNTFQHVFLSSYCGDISSLKIDLPHKRTEKRFVQVIIFRSVPLDGGTDIGFRIKITTTNFLPTFTR
ncbi:hypothetical protein SK128_001785 [Halocaridina rubra]|uniref:Uncharacterized protein n=1 Tax=Halocaridina rubra TaxID=373956 RepID=A0AAN8XR02_HALRR